MRRRMQTRSRRSRRDPLEVGSRAMKNLRGWVRPSTQRAAGLQTSGEKTEVAQASPQRAYPGHAIVFAAQVSAKPTDPEHRLLETGWRGIRHELLLAEADPQRLPFCLAQQRRARGFGCDTGQVTQGDDPHRHCRIQNCSLGQTLGGLQFEFFNLTTALERQMKI